MDMADDAMQMSPAERARASVLMIEPDAAGRNNMRTALKTLGYGGISDVPNHAAAIEKMKERKFTHIIFDAKKTNMPTKDFLTQLFELDNSTVAIPASFEPNVDDVFDLLILGARGYLCKPFTIDTVEQAIVAATKGDPLPPSVLNAKDRNEALTAILMSSLDKAATIMRQAQQFETAKREIPRALASLKRSAEMARMFSKGGEQGLMDAIEKFCIDRSKGPATRLGRLRKRLKTGRVEDEGEEKGEAAPKA
jgi:DNA-binding NarL/FixJ family response regulator